MPHRISSFFCLTFQKTGLIAIVGNPYLVAIHSAEWLTREACVPRAPLSLDEHTVQILYAAEKQVSTKVST